MVKKCWIKNAGEILLAICICIFLGRILCHIYVKDCFGEGASWEKALFYDFYHTEDNIDYLFLGSSHVFYDIIPERLGKEIGENCYSLATPAQSYMTSYYLLREAARIHDISRVYLEMYYDIPLTTRDGQSQFVLDSSWKVLYQMPLSINKLDYMRHVGSGEYRFMTLFPVRQNMEYIFDDFYIRDVIRNKEREAYRNSQYRYIRTSVDVDEFVAKGYYRTTYCYPEGSYTGHYIEIPCPVIEDDAKKYLERIVEYCRKHEIEITFFVSPMPDYQLMCAGNYDDYIEELELFADRHDVTYYDFNLCNLEYLNVSDEKYYMDIGHMNLYGAGMYTDFLAEILLYDMEDKALPDDMFYKTYQEKMALMDEQIFGLDIYQETESKPENEREQHYRVKSVDNFRNQIPEFRIMKLADAAGVEELIQDWDMGNEIIVPEEEHGTIIVEARPAGSEITTNQVKLQY